MDDLRRLSDQEIHNQFHYHPPSTQGVKDLHAAVSDRTCELAQWANDQIPDCRHKSLALTHLELVRMLLNAAVAMTQAELTEEETKL